MKRIVIVGAGVSGLTTAYHIHRLARHRSLAVRVAVLESESRPGGRVWTERVSGFQIEFGANGFLDSKRSTLDLCRDLGLDAELLAARDAARNRYIFWRDRLHPIPARPGELLTTELLSLRGKLRLIGEYFVRPGRGSQEESVHEFARRRGGREAAEVLVDAMVTGIHAGDPALLSVAASFPRALELERNYGSLIRAMRQVRRKRPEEMAANPFPSGTAPAVKAMAGLGGSLWSFRGGMGQLIEHLAESCGAELVRGVAVTRIARREDSQWVVYGEGTDQWQADAVVLACPSYRQAAITESLDAELARRLAEIAYAPVAVVALGFRAADLPRPLDGFGYLAPQRTRRDVLGMLWSSSIFDHRAPAGMVLLQAMCGGWNRPDIVGWDDERLVRSVRAELHQTMQLNAAPALVRIIRWPQAIPQYHLGHLSRVAAIEARRLQFAGLYLTGNSFRGVSVNDCTEEADRCAHEVIAGLGP